MAPGNLPVIRSRAELIEKLNRHITNYAAAKPKIQILEAGCGRKWPLRLEGTSFTLVGIDTDEQALNHRQNEVRDLDKAIVGDLRTIQLPAEEFDVIYCSFVLEHIDGVEAVLKNFARWVKPGGSIILRFPDRDSVFGVITRFTPFWIHILKYRYLNGWKNAGAPGFGPYPTVYDDMLGRSGIRDFCADNDLTILREYGVATYLTRKKLVARLEKVGTKLLGMLSLGKMASTHSGLVYIIRKPET